MRDKTMAMRKISKGAILAIVAVGLVLTVITAGALSMNQTVSSTGTITSVNVGVYSDSDCTQNCTSIDWGSISPGGSVTRTIYVKNTGTAQITLSMTKNSWTPPSADGPITLTWDKESTTLNANEVATATLTLSVSASISGITAFSVNIVITGTG
jgi:hypothetical protein